MQTMTPFDDFIYLVNHVLLGEEPTIEDLILLIGTLVAFIAFILWCCFPIQPKETSNHRQFACKSLHRHHNTSVDANSSSGSGGGGGTSIGLNGASGSAFCSNSSSGGASGNTTAAGGGGAGSNGNGAAGGGSNFNTYSKSAPMLVHNDYIKNGHHCCS